MHRHPITYENFNGEPRQKDLYFNLTEAELTKMQKDYLHVGGIQVVMQAAIDSGDTRKLLDFFELLVHRSYGIKSEDGELFNKSPQIMADFENSAFYSPLYMSFFQDEGRVGQEFIKKVMPKELINKAEANVRGETNAQLHGAAVAEASQAYQPSAREQFAQAQQPVQQAPIVVPEQYQQPVQQPQQAYPQPAQQDFRTPAVDPNGYPQQ